MALLRIFLVIVPFLGWIGYLYLKKARFQQYQNIPRITPNLIWGHLKAVNEYMAAQGKEKHVDYAFAAMHHDAGSPEVLLCDMRPVIWPIFVIFSHAIAEQVAKPSKQFKYSINKSPTVKSLYPLIGSTSIIGAEGEDWKRLRKRFNPGFAPVHLNTLIPAIVKMTRRFMERLDALAIDRGVFEFDELCTSLTFDIIGAVVLDVDFRAQLPMEQQDAIVRKYRDLCASFDDNAPFPFLNWKLRAKQARLGAAVDSSIKEVINQKFTASKEAKDSGDDSSKGRSVLELALKDVEELTPSDLQETADQIKSFLFAGHDTTSIVLQWALYSLSIHPQVLSTLREEINTIFDRDSPIADQILARGEEAISKLTYTSAIIKEILRLYPPAGSARMSPKGTGHTVRLASGEDICIDNFVLYINHYAVQRDPKVFGDNANEFVPERWLGDTDTSMEAEFANDASEKSGITSGGGEKKIPQSAWRPFERGPRNCIGQELANLEARVILACAVRRYDFEKVGVGAVVLGEDGRPITDEAGRYEVGEELFNRRQVTAKPFDRMTVKVRIVEKS